MTIKDQQNHVMNGRDKSNPGVQEEKKTGPDNDTRENSEINVLKIKQEQQRAVKDAIVSCYHEPIEPLLAQAALGGHPEVLQCVSQVSECMIHPKGSFLYTSA